MAVVVLFDGVVVVVGLFLPPPPAPAVRYTPTATGREEGWRQPATSGSRKEKWSTAERGQKPGDGCGGQGGGGDGGRGTFSPLFFLSTAVHVQQLSFS